VGRRTAMKLDRTAAGVTRWIWKWLGWVILVLTFTYVDAFQVEAARLIQQR
jgi:hypothetical protein